VAPSCFHSRRYLAVPLILVVGCGTTRMTDTTRTATEQLLISNAVDRAVSQMDFRCLAGKPVYFDPQFLDGAVDKGYLVGSLRQHLMACGCVLQEDRAKATYVVEARAGAVGTDRNSLLVGVPQMTIPALVPGQPSQIPEIPFAKKTDQNGVAKVAVCAYNRVTGQPVFQSGVVQAVSSAKDVWLFGAGPFQNGTIRHGTEFAGSPIPLIPFGGDEETGPPSPVVGVTQAAFWTEKPSRPLPRLLPDAVSVVAAGDPFLAWAVIRGQFLESAPRLPEPGLLPTLHKAASRSDDLPPTAPEVARRSGP
jgi:hypothetical protein